MNMNRVAIYNIFLFLFIAVGYLNLYLHDIFWHTSNIHYFLFVYDLRFTKYCLTTVQWPVRYCCTTCTCEVRVPDTRYYLFLFFSKISNKYVQSYPLPIVYQRHWRTTNKNNCRVSADRVKKTTQKKTNQYQKKIHIIVNVSLSVRTSCMQSK